MIHIPRLPSAAVAPAGRRRRFIAALLAARVPVRAQPAPRRRGAAPARRAGGGSRAR